MDPIDPRAHLLVGLAALIQVQDLTARDAAPRLGRLDESSGAEGSGAGGQRLGVLLVQAESYTVLRSGDELLGWEYGQESTRINDPSCNNMSM